MSYCRFGDDSDVYVIMNCNDEYECCGCILKGQSFFCKTSEEMIKHLEEHKKAGHLVPQHVIEELKKDN